MKSFLLVLISMFLCLPVLAGEVEIKVEPREPILGEPFRVDFVIKSKDGTDPVINFDPNGVEVISRNESGVSTRTTYINGHLTVERKITISYEMVASRGSSAYLRNINIDLNKEKIKHKTVKIRLLKTAKKPKKVFVIADVSKNKVFVGESIRIRYYLYSKFPINSMDVKKFPKLDKFLKRFHQEATSAERVKYNGEIYTRRIVYTAQVFPENVGKYKIDPISLSVRYSVRSRDPFQGFGIGFGVGKMKRASLRSKAVEIEAISLPVENVPKGFTGLVGKHKFNLKINKNKFLANEPIEIKLSVEGNGALELFEAPQILDNSAIEEFESDVDLSIKKDFSAKKTFDYTYLGRSSVDIKNKSIQLSYFDPDQQKFINVDLKLGDLKVAGVGASANSKKTQVDSKNENKESPVSVMPQVVPEFKFEPLYKGISTYVYHSSNILIFSLGGISIFIFVFLFRFLELGQKREMSFLDTIQKEGINYGKLHKLVYLLGEGSNMKDVISRIDLEQGTKVYLDTLVDDFSTRYKEDSGNDKKIKVSKKYIKEIEKFLINKEKEANEDIQKL